MKRWACWVVAGLGCAPGPAPKEPTIAPVGSTQQPVQPSPAQICAHAITLDKKVVAATCERKVTELRADEPEQYACAAPCAVTAASVAAMDVCFKDCPSKHPKKADPDAEGLRNLGSIEVGSKNQYQQETDTSSVGTGPFVHRFCPSSSKPVPPTLPEAGATYVPTSADWTDPTWQCLKFAINEPMRFQYSYQWNGMDGVESRYTATARRKLASGKTLVIRLTAKGSPTGDAQRVSLTTTEE